MLLVLMVILSTLLMMDVTSFDLIYETEISNITNVCFGFPYNNWKAPTPVKMNITCEPDERLVLDEVLLMRPPTKGDYINCYSRVLRASPYYDEEKCCEEWNKKKWNERYDNCIVPLRTINRTKFGEYSSRCYNNTDCELELEAAILDSYCDTACDSGKNQYNWCWSRRVEVRYTCVKLARNDGVDMTYTTVAVVEGNNMTEDCLDGTNDASLLDSSSSAIILGVCVPLSFLMGIVVAVLIYKLQQRCHKSPSDGRSDREPKTSPSPTANQNTEHQIKAISLVDNVHYNSSEAADHVDSAKQNGRRINYENVDKVVYMNAGGGADYDNDGDEAMYSMEKSTTGQHTMYAHVDIGSHKDETTRPVDGVEGQEEKEEGTECPHVEQHMYDAPYHNKKNCVLCEAEKIH